MLIDIYCKDNKCPICEASGKHSDPDHISFRCVNNCYMIMGIPPDFGRQRRYTMVVTVFRNHFNFSFYNKRDKLKAEIKINDAVSYWKENERYLMELLIK